MQSHEHVAVALNGRDADEAKAGFDTPSTPRSVLCHLPPILSPYLLTLVRVLVYGYNSVALVTLSYFHCQSAGSLGSFVYDYPTIRCDSAEYQRMQVVFLGFLLAVVIAPPTLLTLLMYSQRRHITAHVRAVHSVHQALVVNRAVASSGSSFWVRIVKRLDILYCVYKPGYSGYAVVILLRRLLLIVIFVFIPPSKVFLWLTAANGCILMLHTMCWPYARKRDNVLETVTLLGLFLQTVVVQAWPLPWSHNDTMQPAMLVSLILLLALPTALLLASGCQDKLHCWRQVASPAPKAEADD